VKNVNYSSIVRHESQSVSGVSFEVRRLSLGRRIEMSRKIRSLSARMNFAEAGSTFIDKLESSALALEIERVYLEWGIESIDGLMIDGDPATVESAIASGPENLYREMVDAVRAECELGEQERKN
jgi:hypothetical protein